VSRSFFWEPRSVALHLRILCCGYALSLEVGLKPFAHMLSLATARHLNQGSAPC
jgi:hypothetical protein